MMMKKLWMPVVIPAMVIALSISAMAGIVVDDTFDFALVSDPGTPVATVHSWVTDDGEKGMYRYLYQITGTQYSVNWFSVELLPDALVVDIAPFSGALPGDPIVWAEDADIVSALFIPQIKPGQTSAILWFESDQAPVQVDSTMAGYTGGLYKAMDGTVWSPVPEPATLALLTIGGMGLLMKRKHD